MRYSKWIQEQAKAGEASVPLVGGGELLLAEFEQLLEDTAGDIKGPRGMEAGEGLHGEGASGQLGKHGVVHDFLWMNLLMFFLAPSQRKRNCGFNLFRVILRVHPCHVYSKLSRVSEFGSSSNTWVS